MAIIDFSNTKNTYYGTGAGMGSRDQAIDKLPVGTIYKDPSGNLRKKTASGSTYLRPNDITPAMMSDPALTQADKQKLSSTATTSGVSGGVYGKADFERAMLDYDKSYKAAQQASIAQKQRVMGLHQESLDEAKGLLDTAEGRSLADTRSGYEKQWAGQKQGMISKGLGSAALTTTLGAGYQRQMNEELTRQRATMAGQRIGTLSGLRGNLAGAEERVTQMYPDSSRLMAAAQAYGQGLGQRTGGGYSNFTTRTRLGSGYTPTAPVPAAADVAATPQKRKLSFAEQNEEKLKARIRKKQLEMQLRELRQNEYNQGYTGAIKRGILQKQMRSGSNDSAFNRNRNLLT